MTPPRAPIGSGYIPPINEKIYGRTDSLSVVIMVGTTGLIRRELEEHEEAKFVALWDEIARASRANQPSLLDTTIERVKPRLAIIKKRNGKMLTDNEVSTVIEEAKNFRITEPPALDR